jgi:signal transduction histidine kinase
VQRAIYRTVQEALTNVRKHAPGATATVRLGHEPGAFVVTVTNTPPTRPALPLPGSRQGLVGLKERAELLGGTLEAGATANDGYRVTLRVPANGVRARHEVRPERTSADSQDRAMSTPSAK